jgi:hypothetical protein
MPVKAQRLLPVSLPVLLVCFMALSAAVPGQCFRCRGARILGLHVGAGRFLLAASTPEPSSAASLLPGRGLLLA